MEKTVFSPINCGSLGIVSHCFQRNRMPQTKCFLHKRNWCMQPGADKPNKKRRKKRAEEEKGANEHMHSVGTWLTCARKRKKEAAVAMCETLTIAQYLAIHLTDFEIHSERIGLSPRGNVQATAVVLYMK